MGGASGRLDEADAFVHAATRAFATKQPPPCPPADPVWITRSVTAGVLAPIATALVDGGIDLPTPLRPLRAQVAARHIRHLLELTRVGALLDAAGIAWASMKGPVLRSVVFERPNSRDYADLDVLVAPADVRVALQTLLADGARLRDNDWESALAARTAEIAVVLPHGSLLDLHWSLFNRGAVRDGFDVDTAELLGRRETRTVDGHLITCLERFDFAIHVLVHACLSGGHTLRWILDSHQVLRWIGPDTGGLADRVRSLGVRLPVRASLDLVRDHLDPSVEPGALAGADTPWSAALRRASRRRPPSSPSVHARGARTAYSLTRADAPSIGAAVVRQLGLQARYRRSGWPEPSCTPATSADPGFEAWLQLAEAEGRPESASTG